MRLFGCQFHQFSIQQSTILITVLIEMDNDKIFRRSIGNLSHILCSIDLDYLSIFMFLSFLSEFNFTFGHILSHELVIKIEVILHLIYLLDVFFVQSVLEFVFLCEFVLGFFLDFVQGFFFLFWQIVPIFYLQIKPLCVDSVGHLLKYDVNKIIKQNIVDQIQRIIYSNLFNNMYRKSNQIKKNGNFLKINIETLRKTCSFIQFIYLISVLEILLTPNCCNLIYQSKYSKLKFSIKLIQIMDDSSAEKTCAAHRKPYQYICLDEQCKQKFLLCQTCRESNTHKHSRTAIEDLRGVQHKLSSRWQIKDSKMDAYYKKIRLFYDKLRKDVNDLLNQDQKVVESLLEKISYHHLPIEANSLYYLQFKKEQYERVDKASILKLISQADSGELNRNLEQQKEILNLLDIEMNKGQEKLMTIKYVLLSKKMQAQLLTPQLQDVSKVCQHDDMCKVYGLFNSKNMLIRNCKLIYRASQSNFSNKQFFNSCNNLPNCLALVRLQNGRKIGGFSSIPMVHPLEDDQMKEDVLVYEEDKTKRSFIFSLTNIASFELKNSVRAIAFKKNACGPIFGADLNLSSKRAQSNLGNSYQPAQGVPVDSLQAKVFLLGAGQAPIQEMQIWQLCF